MFIFFMIHATRKEVNVREEVIGQSSPQHQKPADPTPIIKANCCVVLRAGLTNLVVLSPVLEDDIPGCLRGDGGCYDSRIGKGTKTCFDSTVHNKEHAF